MPTIEKETSIDTLMAWREEVIRNVFGVKPTDALLASNRKYYSIHVADGTHIGFVASVDGNPCGCGAICLHDELPSPDNPTGKCAYIMNIYVRKDFRNKGIAHDIVRHLIRQARALGCHKIYLETTPEARNLYVTLGFAPMQDLMKYENNEAC
ncbi:MAG: GNAT family N-acetyltransferase [Muribaculaceae bacterium]|nr:GNAT family N-acetyltransferase [Muribaculaceae bacterium]